MASVSLALLVIGVLCAGLCGALVLPAVLRFAHQGVNHSKRQAKVVGGAGDREALIAGLCRNGIIVFRPLARLVLTIPWLRNTCELCVRVLEIKGHHAYPSAVCETMLAGSALVLLIGLLITGNLLIAVCLVLVAGGVVLGKAKKSLDLWEEKLIEQIPDALRSFGICFNAGYSLQQAFEQAALDTPAPLGMELRQASFDVNAGRSIGEALAALEMRTQASDLRFAVVALEIQHRTGGSLQELLENAAEAVVASCDLRRQLGVQTAQARLSAKVVTILPLVLVAVLSLAMDGYLNTFFSSPAGLGILFIALGMEAIGVLAIRKILGIELG